jgi:DNA-binding response OmpR family regulator
MDAAATANKRVLIVDDDQYVVNFLTMFFKHKGFDASVAHDALELERQLAQPKLDVVVLDIRLKDAEGTHLIPKIREKHPSIPIVMLTGLGYDEDLMNDALKAGANGYVSKTLPPEELFAAVLRALGT